MKMRKCKYCGCHDNDACYHPEYGNCWWLNDDTCSHCIDVSGEAVRYSEFPKGTTEKNIYSAYLKIMEERKQKQIKEALEPFVYSPIHLKGEIETGRVWLFGKELLPEESLKLLNKSPDGFSWGYGGSAPSQLALAICLELFGKDVALSIFQEFKRHYIATLEQDDFNVDFTLIELIKDLQTNIVD